MISTNIQGVALLLVSPFVYYANIFFLAQLSDRLPYSFREHLPSLPNFDTFPLTLYWFTLMFFIVGFWEVWQIAKRLIEPKLSDRLMLIIIGLFSSKLFFTPIGTFVNYGRIGFNPWISLWLFAPFLLMACAKGEGWQYLKKYLWYPIVLDSLVLIYGYWFGNLSQTLKDVSILNLMALLFAYIALLVGFVKYTEWTYEPAKHRWYIPTAILAIPAFTIGLFITFLFLIMF